MISATTITELSWFNRSRGKGIHLCVIAIVLAVVATAIAPTLAEVPTPISADIARSYLSELKVEPENNSPAYVRTKFRHWITISGTCNTRETALKRDGIRVVTDSLCAPTSGTWVSPYDGATWKEASDLDIDHVVPLKEAWVSGARLWTAEQRQAFANDLTQPQLMVVTDNVNQAKGDKDPAEWMPPLSSFHCTYLRAYVQVKHFYNLTVDSSEKNAISSKLAPC
ncbi:hypothetical protein EC968_004571 [Mortierella alpina]|nr:hypothetical protein EC968_004571 [Mortierella alpina]